MSEKYECPCCGYNTFDSPDKNDYSICPVCYWERDKCQLQDEDFDGGANKVSLKTARENFKKFGASEERFIDKVRKPLKEEM